MHKQSRSAKFRKWIEKRIANMEGGFLYSDSIRKIYEECYGIRIGYGTYGGCWNNSTMWGSNIEIGNWCSFAGVVYMVSGNHSMDKFTTHPIVGSEGYGKLTIGHGVWMGLNATIMPGCHHVGNGAVIGGAVVTKDVPPYAILAGNPAKIIKYRLTPEQIEKVEASQWWMLDKNELKTRIIGFLALTK